MVLSDDFYYQPIRLDTINTQIYTDFIAKEGDAGGRGLKVTITENGVTKNTTGITLNLKWEHTAVADLQGLEPFEAVDLTKGIYKLKYPTNMLQKGTVKALIQIIDNGGLAGSRNLKIKVDSTVGDDTAMESSNEFTTLVTALVKTNHMENLLNETIANVTVDSEVITARNSTAKQKTFTVLDERMEDLEKDVYYPANNELTQSDFAATTGWSVYQGTLAVANNVASVTGTSGLYPNVYQDINCEVGDKLYYAAQARVTTTGATAIALRSEGVEITTDNARVLAPVANQWYQLDCIKTAFETTPSFAVSQRYALAADATGKVLQIKKPIALNLTKIFGANAIPTIEQIRAILSRFTDSHFVGNEGLSQPALLMGKALSLEAQFNAAVAGLTVDDETINARVGKDNTTHATLKARLDSEKSTTDQSLVSLGQQLEQAAILSTTAFPRNVGETEDGLRIQRMFSHYDTTNKKVLFKFDEGSYTLTTSVTPPSNCILDFCQSTVTSNILTSVFAGIINISEKENIEIFDANIDGNVKSLTDYTNLIATHLDIPAIYIYCSKNIRVHDNVIENVANSFVQVNSYNALSHGYGTALGVDKYSEDIKIHDNKLKNSWYDTGIAIFGGCVNDFIINSDTTKNVDVYGNEISYVGLTEFGKYASRIEGEGIELDNGTSLCEIYDNEIHHCMTAINADDGSTKYSICDNNIHDCDDGISLFPKFNMSNTGILINNQYYICKAASILRNKISNVANTAISLLHGSLNDVIGMAIKDNIIDGCKDGLNLYEAHYDLAGNLITTGLPSGNDVTSGLIDNLIVDGNVVRNASEYALNVGKILHGSNIRIRNNFLDGVTYDIRIDQCTGITYDNNLLKHGTISDNSTMPTGLIGNKIKTIIKSTPPTVGAWNQGDICINPLTYNGQYEKFVCSAAGTPGTWQGINQIGFNNLLTSARPVTGIYRGYYYFDTTLNKFCYYNGTVWTDAMGTVV